MASRKKLKQKFSELALDKYDFARCQRADGSYYGTGGTCRKGSPVGENEGKKEKKPKVKSAASEAKAKAKAVAASIASEMADEMDLDDKQKAKMEKALTAAGAAAIAGKDGAAMDAIDKATHEAELDMEQRERMVNEIGALGKPVEIAPGFETNNLIMKSDWKTMDEDDKEQITEAFKDFKKGDIDADEMREIFEVATVNSIETPRIGQMRKDLDAAADFEDELEEIQINRWHDAAYNSVDSGASSLTWSLSSMNPY